MPNNRNIEVTNDREVEIKKLHKDAIIPRYAYEKDAGFDLHALESGVLRSGEITLIGTGLAMNVPRQHYLKITTRSGLARKHGMVIVTGTVDSGYLGEIHIVATLLNLAKLGGRSTYAYKAGERIAQGILLPIAHASFTEVWEFEEKTERGENGYGSTGG